LAPALIAYGWLAWSLRFIQDDAYISYRYVANFLNGHGLVYNIGERVEGFTNFGWVVWMALWGTAGDIYILVSRLTGLLCGAGVIVLTFLIARELFGRRDLWPSWLAAWLVGFNMSLAYWAPAGLETAAFALMAVWSVYLYLRRSWLLIWTLLMAVWMRPEGAFLSGLLIFVEALTERRIPRYTLLSVAAAFVLSLPFVGFKLAYYGSLLPNPFYAKTGWHIEQVTSGLEYMSRFWSHYGFYGAGLIVCLALFGRLTRSMRFVWWLVVLYTIYIVLVGGDVLKVHRFFVPLMGPVAIVSAMALWLIARGLAYKNRVLVVSLVGVGMIALTLALPRGFVNRYNYTERMFTMRMQWMAQRIDESDNSDFSVALPTIGIFGYKLIGHEIIDMLGLTDSTIARYSEKPIEGMKTTWKERSHNSRYLLRQVPDYIMFSTGIKPSAPAERALSLFPEFLDSYRTIGWYYNAGDPRRKGSLSVVFRRVNEVEGPLEPAYPVEYVQEYKKGLDDYMAGRLEQALAHYDKAMGVSPQPYNPYLVEQKGLSLMLSSRHAEAQRLLDSLVSEDSLIFEAHKNLYVYAHIFGDTAKASTHGRWLQKLVPWYWPRVQSEADGVRRSAMEQMRRLQQQQQGAP
jgi:tetratricopeptide (TPR) repeat protein